MANGNTPPPGSYQQTSRDIQFSGDVITATCQKIDGSWVQSSLRYDIANCNGQLTWAPNGCP